MNYATVAEAVDALSKEPFAILAPTLPNGAVAVLHLAISDATGNSAIFEYIDGKLVIHHGKQYAVMSKSPAYNQQLAIDAYWKGGWRARVSAWNQSRVRPVCADIVFPERDPAASRSRFYQERAGPIIHLSSRGERHERATRRQRAARHFDAG